MSAIWHIKMVAPCISTLYPASSRSYALDTFIANRKLPFSISSINPSEWQISKKKLLWEQHFSCSCLAFKSCLMPSPLKSFFDYKIKGWNMQMHFTWPWVSVFTVLCSILIAIGIFLINWNATYYSFIILILFQNSNTKS